MKRFGFFFVLLMASGSLLMGQSLDDVLAKHAKAAGYDKLSKVKSIRIKGVMTRSVLFSNYEDVEGVKIAFSRKIIMQGTPGGSGKRGRGGPAEIRYKKIEFNVPLDDSLFTKVSLSRH